MRKKHLCWVFENKDEFAGKVGECNVGARLGNVKVQKCERAWPAEPEG